MNPTKRRSRVAVALNRCARLAAVLTAGTMLSSGCLPRDFWGTTAGSLVDTAVTGSAGALLSVFWAPMDALAAAIAALVGNALGAA